MTKENKLIMENKLKEMRKLLINPSINLDDYNDKQQIFSNKVFYQWKEDQAGFSARDSGLELF